MPNLTNFERTYAIERAICDVVDALREAGITIPKTNALITVKNFVTMYEAGALPNPQDIPLPPRQQHSPEPPPFGGGLPLEPTGATLTNADVAVR